MRAAFLLDGERRDLAERPWGARRPTAGAARTRTDAEDLALRRPAEFVTSADDGGRIRLLKRFKLANRLRRSA